MKAMAEKVPPVASRTLRIFVADDHELVRQALRGLLESEPGWEVCGEASAGNEVAEKVQQLQPDVVVLDVHMPGMDGLETAKQVLTANPKTEILILTLDESPALILNAARVGARGIVLKSDTTRELIAAVSALGRHELYYAPKTAQIAVRTFARPLGATPPTGASRLGLTSREQDIVVLIAQGQSHKQMAAELHISTKTVETHRHNIRLKLGVHSTAELVRHAVQNGFVQP
jgi:DNA-binding NarL/FixJ family response regulator